MEADNSRAAETGLACRPVADTVADTWRWLQLAGVPARRPDRDVHGLPPDIEHRILSTR